MRNARLVSLTVERFKSFAAPTRVDLAPLTVILGRNNSGKSTLIQALLLLKQTLADPRSEVALRLEGTVEAFSLRELTHGWPAADGPVDGPAITVEWESEVDVAGALKEAGRPDKKNLVKHSGVRWLHNPPDRKVLHTALKVQTRARGNDTELATIELISKGQRRPPTLTLANQDGTWSCSWQGEISTRLDWEFEHFIPYLWINRSKLGPRHRERAWYNAWLILFAQPLQALKDLLAGFHYLGSTRQVPPALYRPATEDPFDIGVSGERAALLLQRRQHDLVHFLPPLVVTEGGASIPEGVEAAPLSDAINRVLRDLGIEAPLRVEEAQLGFRLIFGEASLPHVGRGLSYLLPLVELGLFADPLRFSGVSGRTSIDAYQSACADYTHLAVEEPEAHLHPKVASRLAHWLVSLAMARRRLIVETHSDHLVRRLRGLVARAGHNTELEKWLLKNVAILGIEQDHSGCSTVTSSRLTAEGGLAEVWPADFMDEATEEESAIYYARLDKAGPQPAGAGDLVFDDGEEPEVEP